MERTGDDNHREYESQELQSTSDMTPGASILRFITQADAVLLHKDVVGRPEIFRCRPAPGSSGPYVPYSGSDGLDRSGSAGLIFPCAAPTLYHRSGERPGFLGGNCAGLIHPEWRERPVAFQALHLPHLRSLQKTCLPIMPHPTRRPISTSIPVFS